MKSLEPKPVMPVVNEADEIRIKPVENPKSLKLKFAYWIIKKKMGKVITPFKVVQARMPDTVSLTRKLVSIEQSLSLSSDLIFYIKTYVATLNGCAFCIDIAKANAEVWRQEQKSEQLLRYESSAAFNKAEKAALKYVEQITQKKEATDEVFENLQTYFSEQEIVEITWLNAMENYFNLINKPLKIGSDGLCDRNKH